MDQEILDKIKTESLARNPEESCGLILNDSLFFACKNCHDNKLEHFKININEYLKASKLGKITHLFHSHPTEKKEFSILDKTISEEFNLNLILYHLPDDSFLYYTPNGFKNPYVGRKFKWGKYDCFSIVKMYYKEELKIDLDEEVKERGRDFFKRNSGLFSNNEYLTIAERNNLEVLSKNTRLLKNDIILFKNPGNTDYHFGIYVDDNSYLHVPDNSISQVSLLTEERKNDIHSIIRKKETL